MNEPDEYQPDEIDEALKEAQQLNKEDFEKFKKAFDETPPKTQEELKKWIEDGRE